MRPTLIVLGMITNGSILGFKMVQAIITLYIVTAIIKQKPESLQNELTIYLMATITTIYVINQMFKTMFNNKEEKR